MADTIQLRRDTAANWVTANPVLHDGEIGIETDTRKRKCGNGTTAWNSLSYMYSDDLDAEPTANSHKPVESGGTKAAIDIAAEIGLAALDAIGDADNVPTEESTELVRSGGVWEAIRNNGKGAFDISAYKAVGGVLAKYDDLAQALGTNGANVPAAARKPGMSVCFVLNSDNKYVQFRLMKNTWSTTVSDWQGVDEEPTPLSNNLVESGGVARNLYNIQARLVDIGTNVFVKSQSELLGTTIDGKVVDISGQLVDSSLPAYYVKTYPLTPLQKLKFIHIKVTAIFNNRSRWVVSAWKNGVFVKGLLRGSGSVTQNSQWDFDITDIDCDTIYASLSIVTEINVSDNTLVDSEKERAMQAEEELSDEIKNVASHLLLETEKQETLSSKYVKTDGTVATSSGQHIDIYNVQEGDFVQGSIITGDNTYAISYWNDDTFVRGTVIGVYGQTKNISEFVPAGCNKVYVCGYTTSGTKVYHYESLIKLENSISTIERTLSEFEDITNQYNTTQAGWINKNDGQINTSSMQTINTYLVAEGEYYKVTASPSGSDVSAVNYYNSYGFVGYEHDMVNGTYTKVIQIPSGVNIMRVCGLNGSLIVEKAVLANDIALRVDELEKEIINAGLIGKEIVILGDSSCDKNYTNWAKYLYDNASKYGVTVIVKAVTSTGWSVIGQNTNTVQVQWNSAKQEITTTEPIIIITTGGNQLDDLQATYEEAIALCESDTTGLSNAKETAVQTMKNIFNDKPAANLFLVSNFYADSSNTKNNKRRVYRNFLTGMCDYFSCSLIDLTRNSQIRGYMENDANSPGYHLHTTDGIHAYKEIGYKKLFRIIMGNVLTPYLMK